MPAIIYLPVASSPPWAAWIDLNLLPAPARFGFVIHLMRLQSFLTAPRSGCCVYGRRWGSSQGIPAGEEVQTVFQFSLSALSALHLRLLTDKSGPAIHRQPLSHLSLILLAPSPLCRLSSCLSIALTSFSADSWKRANWQTDLRKRSAALLLCLGIRKSSFLKATTSFHVFFFSAFSELCSVQVWP